ncbi:MAG: hypothetical protein GXO07_07185 [Crenarchaeota archaeon]|nr:hypothetical protein [Thermoproteota archaeon]
MDLLSLALLLLGFPLGRTRLRELAGPLSKFLIFVVEPVLGFWAGVNVRSTLVAFAAVLPEIPIFYAARALFRGCSKKGAAGITAAFGNTIFLGIPAVLAVGGNVDAAVAYAMMTTLIHFTFASLYSCKKGSALIKVQPFTVTFLLGLLLSPFSEELSFIVWTKELAAEASRLGLLILGLAFEAEHLKLDGEVLRIGLLKHGLLPLLTLPFALTEHTKALIVESSMPPAFMNIALAYVYEYDVSMTTKAVITLTLLWVPFFVLFSFFFH